MLALLQGLWVDPGFINLKSDIKAKKYRCGTARQLITNTAIPLIPLYICEFSSLKKYIAFMMTATLKIFYGTEKNIGSTSYLQM